MGSSRSSEGAPGAHNARQAATPRPVPVLPYNGPKPARPGESRNSFEWVIGSKSRDFAVPLAMTVGGLGLLLFGRSFDTDDIHLDTLLTIVTTAIVVAVISLAIVRRLADLEMGTPTATVLKLLAVATAPPGVGLTVMWHMGCFGLIAGPAAHFLVCWIAFAYLFRAGLAESAMCVAVLWTVSVASWVIVGVLLTRWMIA